MRVDLALIVCGNRICEVITATLGPLPLDQLQKSKPVTPYAVFPDDRASAARGNTPATPGIPGNTVGNVGRQHEVGSAGPVAKPGAHAGKRKPLRALAVAEDAPAGV